MKRSLRGVTLVEAVLAALLTGLAFMIGVIGINFINGLSEKSAELEVSREAQIVLYLMTKDIRNSDAVIEVNETGNHVLSLQQYDYSHGYSIHDKPDLFNETNISTVTYSYSEAADFLMRTYEVGGQSKIQKLLRGLIKLKDGEKIFNADTNTSIEITLRLGKGLMKDRPRVFHAEAMVRGQ